MRTLLVFLLLIATPAAAWNNGRNGQCPDPGYATHDWIADHARAMLPAAGTRRAVQSALTLALELDAALRQALLLEPLRLLIDLALCTGPDGPQVALLHVLDELVGRPAHGPRECPESRIPQWSSSASHRLPPDLRHCVADPTAGPVEARHRAGLVQRLRRLSNASSPERVRLGRTRSADVRV